MTVVFMLYPQRPARHWEAITLCVSVETMKGSLEKVIRLNRLKTKYG